MIEQSPNDNRIYQYLELDNQLKVLLISDPSADKAAAALKVNVGSGQDPVQFPGLAHFLEHMLFLGTKKYPDAGSYEAYISSHSGSHNAYTANDSTNYFFEINPDYLPEALDRFSQFFIAPTLDEQYVDKERNAVHSEYTMKLKDDWRRIAQVLKETANPAHPYSHFSVGTLDTLKDSTEQRLQNALLDFYHQYYCAQQMNLVILGNQPINQLKDWAQQYFNAVVKTENCTVTQSKEPLFLPAQKSVQINIIPNADVRQLMLNFPIHSVKKDYLAKPDHYVSHLLGHEGQGSLLQYLKSQNLASALSTGLMYGDDNDAIFSINIELTEQGLQQYQQIAGLVFSYIQKIKQEGIRQDIFNELQTMMSLDFQFKEKNQSINYVTTLAENMSQFPAEHLLKANYILTEFAKEKYLQLLAQLNVDNLRLVLVAKGLETNQTDPWYNTPYQIKALTPEQKQAFNAQGNVKALAIPQNNPFLPTDTRLRALPNTPAAIPNLLINDTGIRLWHLQETLFRVPKSNIYLNINSAKTNADYRAGALSWILVEALNDALGQYAYNAQIAGQSYSISKSYTGFDIQLSGFNDKQPELLRLILNQLATLTLDEATFSRLKERLQRRWQNAKKQKPFQQVGQQLYRLLLTPSGSAEQFLATLPSIQLKDFEQFKTQLFSQHAATLFVHGNTTAQEAIQLMSQVNSQLYKMGQKTEFAPVKLTHLSPKTHFSTQIGTDSADSAATLYLQAPDSQSRNTALINLLQRVIKSPFYTQLRTNEQLGYVVYSYPIQLYGLGGLGFTIQSPNKSADFLGERMQQYLLDAQNLLTELPEEEFMTQAKGLLVELEKAPVQLAEKSARLWNEIEKGNRNFDSRTQLIAAVKSLKLADLQKFYTDLITTERREILLKANDVTQSDKLPNEIPVNTIEAFRKAQHLINIR